MELSPNGVAGAANCLLAIFAPGLLLVTGVLPFWNLVRARPTVGAGGDARRECGRRRHPRFGAL